MWPEVQTTIREEKKKTIAECSEVHAKLQSARRNSEIYEILADDKDYLKVIAEARLKLDNNKIIVVLCVSEDPAAVHRKSAGLSLDQETQTPDTDAKRANSPHVYDISG